MAQAVTIDRLLNLVPDAPETVLTHLQSNPELASKQDRHGYSLLHAATSYGQVSLLRTLIEEYRTDPNLRDEDGETCLFNAETVAFAKELLKLGVQADAKNHDGLTAAEKLDDEDEQPIVAAYLREIARRSAEGAASSIAQTAGANDAPLTQAGTVGAANPPPPLPQGVQVNIGTMQSDEVGEEPDPEFRRRIEALAARQDFEGEEGQRELRDLVSEAVSGLANDGQGPASRRRLG